MVMIINKRRITLGIAFLGMSYLNAMTFDFGPLNKSSVIEVELKTNGNFAEHGIRGNFSNIVGQIKFFASNPNLSDGEILLDSRSLRFGYHRTNTDAKDKKWLNSANHPKISFKLKSLNKIAWKERALFAQAQGTLSFKQAKHDFSLPVEIRYFRAERKKYDGRQGDLITIKGEKSLSLEDLDMVQGAKLGEISNEILVKISLVGASNRIRPLLPTHLLASP
jgi:polyisoprenoid-binding protein YceI